MQIGMMGLGRMGATWFAACCATDTNALSTTSTPPVSPHLVKGGAIGAASVEEFVGKLSKPRSAWLMLPAAITGRIVETWPA